jgi:hypothetical protein
MSAVSPSPDEAAEDVGPGSAVPKHLTQPGDPARLRRPDIEPAPDMGLHRRSAASLSLHFESQSCPEL